MNKRSLFKESFYATAFILAVLFGLSKIEINSDVVNPISKAMNDFELTDIVFSQLRESQREDTNIVMVNLGPSYRDRHDLARMINILTHYDPMIIGIDAFFRKPSKDSVADAALREAFSKVRHLVLVSQNNENKILDIIDSMSTSHPMFMQYAEPGFADMITKSVDHFKTSRECSPKETVKVPLSRRWIDSSFTRTYVENGITKTEKIDTVICKVEYGKDTVYYSFPVKIASIFAPEKAKAFIDRNYDTETINWQGNIDTRQQDVAKNAKGVFSVLDWEQVEDTLFVPELLKNKIVIIGYMGDVIGHNAWEDKFFTPLNANYIGKANPDMYGVVVHANVVSMILKGDFIDEMPSWMMFTFSLILIFLNTWFFSYLYYRTEVWYDGLSLLLTLAEILVLMIVVLLVFNWYNYKIDITLASVALFLTGNLIEIHYGIVKPSLSKIAEKTKFFNKKLPIFTKN